MEKAYRNEKFINSTAARPLRILAEYMEPHQRLADNGITRSITFWGSARLAPGQSTVSDGRDYHALARELARQLASWTLTMHAPNERYHILTGAGPGIMEAAHAGAAELDPNLNLGLNISLPFEQDSNSYIPEQNLFEFHYFFTRKFWFLKLSAALVVFPGGFGTLDELFEVLTLIQTGKTHPRPILLFGKEFWNSAINLPGLARQGLISESDLELVCVVDDVEAAFNRLTTALPATIPAD